MKITIEKKGTSITDIPTWFRVAPPKGGKKQWKEGRSAWAMANYVLNFSSNFKEMIEKILNDCQIQKQSFKCEPEASAGLGTGFGGGGSRNHDMLMIGENCVIGIEAKVSESFDDEIGKVISEGGTRAKRASKLIQYFAPGLDDDKLKEIGYQLFTATRGTLCSSEKEDVSNAIFLVVVFTGYVKRETDYDKRIRKNEEGFNSFLHYINAEDGMIKRQVNGKTINCWIKKIEVEIEKTHNQFSFKFKS